MVHITYPILCMSYSYTYMTFMIIYYTICYLLFAYIVIMYCHRVLISYTVSMYCFMYYFHILFSYYTFHITFSFMYYTCSYSFRVIDTLLLVLVNLSYYHRIAVLCFSYRVIYSIHFICFMFHACINLRSG